LTPRATTVGSIVKAKVTASIRSGAQLSKVKLNWGDGSPRVTVRHLTFTRTHQYSLPGKFAVTAIVVDKRGDSTQRSKAKEIETVKVPSGSYSGVYSVGGGVGPFTFYVPADHASVQDVAANITVECSPGGARSSGEYVIDSIPLNPDGSFDTTSTNSDVWSGSPATLKFTFQGHFGGLDATGHVEAAGSLTATVTYNNGTAYSCTSGKLPWTMTRDAQPTPQPTSPPPSGSYAGHYSVPGAIGPLAFSVSSNQASVQDVSAKITVECSPGGARSSNQFVVDNLPLNSDGSFSTTSTQDGTFGGQPAQYQFMFQGHFHGVNAQGVARAAGSLVATVTYSDGTAHNCTSDRLPWTATHS
jgi:hypothetical protein